VNRSRVQYFVQRVIPPVLVFFIIVGGLEFALRKGQVEKFKFPLPSAVLTCLFTDRGDLLPALWTTTEETLLGFAASTVVGISVAILLSAFTWVRRAFYPYTLFFQTVPMVAIAPLLILFIEPGLTLVSVSAFIVSVFPVIANTLAGLTSTDPALVDLFKLYNAGPISRLFKLRLPYAMPSIVNGLRVAAGLAVIGAIVGEVLVGVIGPGEGLGVMIKGANKNFRLDLVFAEVLLASLLGLALFAAVNAFGYLVLRRWQPSE
jgi:NitT/TauT family transport system permease protein